MAARDAALLPDTFKTLKRSKLSLNDSLIHGWVTDFVWKCLDGALQPPGTVLTKLQPPKGEVQGENLELATAEITAQVLTHHNLQGLAFSLYGPKLPQIFNDTFLAQL